MSDHTRTIQSTSQVLWSPWTPEQDAALRLHYGVLSSRAIWEQRLVGDRSLSGIRYRAYALGLKSDVSPNKRKYSFNESFWKVPNPTNAYWAGFVAADGYYVKRGPKSVMLNLTMAEKDRSHLERFKADIDFTGPIKSFGAVCNLANDKTPHPTVAMNIWQMVNCVDDLEGTWGIHEGKTLRMRPPELDDLILKWCYIRGYYDGDGSITADYNTGYPNLTVTSSTYDILAWLKAMFDEYFPVDRLSLMAHRGGANVTTPADERTWRLVLGGFRAAKIIDILSRLPTPFLARKWQNPRILAMIESYKTRFPAEWSVRLPIEDEIDTFVAAQIGAATPNSASF